MRSWASPPIPLEDLQAVLELLGRDAGGVLRGWVLVPPDRLPYPPGTLASSVGRFRA